MSNDLNHCSFIGRLGRDPETRYLPNGDAVTNFSIAVGESWKNKETGEINESVEWVRVTAWRKLGEICGEYLKKGAQVYVSGKMKTREWEQDGVKRYTTEVVIDKMQMLGGKKDAEPAEQREPEQKPAKKSAGGAGKFDDMDDDIPF
jgi:single-strand DNA-binding protein